MGFVVVLLVSPFASADRDAVRLEKIFEIGRLKGKPSASALTSLANFR